MEAYYLSQAENGISDGGGGSGSSGGRGANRHLGRGFFTSALGLVSRALPFLGRSLLNTAVNVADQLKSTGDNGASVKEALKKSAVEVLNNSLDSVKMKASKSIMGAGRRKRTRRSVATKKIGGKRSTTTTASSKTGAGRRRRKRRSKPKVKGLAIGGQRRKKKHSKFNPHLW